MVIICQQCSARLQLDDTKIPARSFTVRCPKCQHMINAQPPAPATVEQGASNRAADAAAVNSRFERPRPAPAYKPEAEAADSSQGTAGADSEEAARLLASLFQRAMGSGVEVRAGRRPRTPARAHLRLVRSPFRGGARARRKRL
jgi:predicted Zn finger-like uncharacterized protein